MPDSKEPPEGKSPLIGGKTLSEWDLKWKRLEGGFRIVHSDLSKKVGLFRARLGSHIIAIGVGRELDNGGLRKRLSDFRRISKSGRDHKFGLFINEHLHELTAEVLVTGSDEAAKSLATALKKPMIERHKPSENVPEEIIISRMMAPKKLRKLKSARGLIAPKPR